MRRVGAWYGMLAGAILLAGGAVSVRADDEQPAAAPADILLADFENGLEEWEIPNWALTSADYACKEVTPAADFVSTGKGSAQLMVDFPGGGKWTGAYLERVMYVTDWGQFSSVAGDVYLPYDAPEGLKARFILTVGEQWQWTEMNRAINLKPDQWTTISANLKPGSLDWKFFPDEGFRKDIRKIGIRIESDRDPAYKGPVYVDNVRLVK
ncbi:MAG: hypothetical protein HYY15_04320 [Candidatus Omnitrophica bacterium]|nr:hypothetical protein [Candidatus Omnitrophota bacterium]